MPKYKIEVQIETDDVHKVLMSLMNTIAGAGNWTKQSIHMELVKEDEPAKEPEQSDATEIRGLRLANGKVDPFLWANESDRKHPSKRAGNTWNIGTTKPENSGVYERNFTDGIHLHLFEAGEWKSYQGFGLWKAHHHQVGAYAAWREVDSIAIRDYSGQEYSEIMVWFAILKYGNVDGKGWIDGLSTPNCAGRYEVAMPAGIEVLEWSGSWAYGGVTFTTINGGFPAWRRITP